MSYTDRKHLLTATKSDSIDLKTARLELAEFLLSDTPINFEDLKQVFKLAHSYCNGHYVQNGENGFDAVNYYTKISKKGEQALAYAQANNLTICLDKINMEDISDNSTIEISLFDKIKLLDNIFHEHRHIADFYNNEVKREIGQPYTPNFVSPVRAILSNNFIEYLERENQNSTDNKIDIESYKSTINNYLYYSYVLTNTEKRARQSSLTLLKEDLLPFTKSIAPTEEKFEAVDIAYDSICYYLKREKIVTEESIPLDYKKAYPEIFDNFKKFQLSCLKDFQSSLDIPSSLDISHELEKAPDMATACAISLNVSYDDEIAQQLFKSISTVSTTQKHLYQDCLQILLNYTAFNPTREQLADSYSSFGSFFTFAILNLTSFKPEDLIEAYANATKDEEIFSNYHSYKYIGNSNFINNVTTKELQTARENYLTHQAEFSRNYFKMKYSQIYGEELDIENDKQDTTQPVDELKAFLDRNLKNKHRVKYSDYDEDSYNYEYQDDLESDNYKSDSDSQYSPYDSME